MTALVVYEGEAIWNACLGSTALALNVHLPSTEVLLLSGLFLLHVSTEVSVQNLQSNNIKNIKNGQRLTVWHFV